MTESLGPEFQRGKKMLKLEKKKEKKKKNLEKKKGMLISN